jgi:hypothetical protein
MSSWLPDSENRAFFISGCHHYMRTFGMSVEELLNQFRGIIVTGKVSQQ